MKKLSVLFLGMVLLAGCGETSSTRKPEKEDVLKSSFGQRLFYGEVERSRRGDSLSFA